MSASPGQVLRIAAPVLLVCAAVAWGVATLGPQGAVERSQWLLAQEGLAAAETLLVEHLEQHPDDSEAWHALVRQRGWAASLKEALTLSPTTGTRSLVLNDPGTGLTFDDRTTPALDDAAFDAFLNKASSPAPDMLRVLLGYATDHDADKAADALAAINTLEALTEAARVQLIQAPDKALALADKAVNLGRDDEANDARRLALSALSRMENTDELERRLQDKQWRRAADPRVRIDVALAQKNPVQLLIASTLDRFERADLTAHLAALVAGLCWAVVLLLLGGIKSWSPAHKGMALLAVVLGIGSGMLTLAAAIGLDHSLNYADHVDDEVFKLAYYVLGVGFKEEAIKLLCFVPLLPLVLRIQSDAVVITLASLVGLGFAMEENTGYFCSGCGSVVMSRFLTANFLHITTTGIAGFFLVRAIRLGGEHWNQFTTEFFKVVGVHGLYDFLISTTLIEGGGFFSMTAFVILSQWYLRLLMRMKRPGAPRSDRMIVYFTWALSLAVGVNLVFVASEVGLSAALQAVVAGSLGNALIAIMFYREL